MQKIVCHQGGRCTHIAEIQQGNTKKITSTRMNAQHTDQQNTNEIQRGGKKKKKKQHLSRLAGFHKAGAVY